MRTKCRLSIVYRKLWKYEDEKPVGEHSFRQVCKAVTSVGTYNEGLSYYYVRQIELLEIYGKIYDRFWISLDGESNEAEVLDEIKAWFRSQKQTQNEARHTFGMASTHTLKA